MKIAIIVLSVLLILGGLFVWQRNHAAYDMQQSLATGSPISQVLESSAKWRSCDFESASRATSTGSRRDDAIKITRGAPEMFHVTFSTASTSYTRDSSRPEVVSVLTEKIAASNEVWLGTCHFTAIPHAMHVQMLLAPDAKITQSTNPYIDDVEPNAPRLDVFRPK